jgi:hypothetical protein
LIFPFPALLPAALRVAEALSAVGAFSRAGLNVMADIWGKFDFQEKETRADAERLTEQMLTRFVQEDLPTKTATQQDVSLLYHGWQMPMYNFEFRLIDVPLDDLHRERDALLWAEVGY